MLFVTHVNKSFMALRVHCLLCAALSEETTHSLVHCLPLRPISQPCAKSCHFKPQAQYQPTQQVRLRPHNDFATAGKESLPSDT